MLEVDTMFGRNPSGFPHHVDHSTLVAQSNKRKYVTTILGYHSRGLKVAHL